MRPPAKSSTRGSSRRAATATPANRVAGAASTNWLRSIRFSGFTVLMLVVLVLFVVVVAPGARIFIEQRQQIADLQNSLQSAQAQNVTLNSQVARWGDPAYIRAEARERLYFVMPGETAFLVLNDTQAGSAASSAPVSTSIQPTQTNWMAALFASGMTAGLSTQTADQLGAAGQLGSGASQTDPTATPMPTPTP
ncbi:MAG: hypothetical protein JWQ19_2258 [Subtercola sp.]|nr:hypothetical protein [Subtercola sp.]